MNMMKIDYIWSVIGNDMNTALSIRKDTKSSITYQRSKVIHAYVQVTNDSSFCYLIVVLITTVRNSLSEYSRNPAVWYDQFRRDTKTFLFVQL